MSCIDRMLYTAARDRYGTSNSVHQSCKGESHGEQLLPAGQFYGNDVPRV